ncbi:MAG: ribonuclease HII [Candidatus Pacearchaeota archaeon]
MLELGIDDAGRGPVIGPMILSGVLMDNKHSTGLRKLGVRDSKQLTEKRREFLVDKIKEKIEAFEVVIVKPEQIDKLIKEGTNLNEIEAIACAKIINKINKGYGKIRVIVDCPSTSIIKWQDLLKTKIDNLSNLEILCQHKADQNHISVSAASILAKNTREKEMKKLKEIYGEEIGSGYTSDPLTKTFLAKNLKKHNDKGIFRKSWATWKQAIMATNQTKLGDF